MGTDPSKSVKSSMIDILQMMNILNAFDDVFKKLPASFRTSTKAITSALENPFLGMRKALPTKIEFAFSSLFESINFSKALDKAKHTGYKHMFYTPKYAPVTEEATSTRLHKAPTNIFERLTSFSYYPKKAPEPPTFDFASGIGAKLGGGKLATGFSKFLGATLEKPMNALSGTLPKIGGLLASPFVIAGKAMGGMAQFTGKLLGVKPSTMAAIGEAVGSLKDAAMQGGMMALANIVLQLVAAMNPFKDVLDALTTIFSIYGDVLSQAFLPLIEMLFAVMLDPAVMTVFMALTEAITQIVISLMPLVYILMPIFTTGLTILAAVFQFISPWIAALSGPLQIVGAWMQGLSGWLFGIFAVWNQTLGPLFVDLAKFFNFLWALASTTIEGIMGVVGLLFAGLAYGFNLIRSMGDSFATGLKTIANFIVDLVNGLIGVINKADVLNVVPDIATIPRFGNGGIVYQPTLAIVGEKGPEEIRPVGQGGNRGSITIVVNGDLTEEKLFKLQREAWLNSL